MLVGAELGSLVHSHWEAWAFGPQASTAFAMIALGDLRMTHVGLISMEKATNMFFLE